MNSKVWPESWSPHPWIRQCFFYWMQWWRIFQLLLKRSASVLSVLFEKQGKGWRKISRCFKRWFLSVGRTNCGHITQLISTTWTSNGWYLRFSLDFLTNVSSSFSRSNILNFYPSPLSSAFCDVLHVTTNFWLLEVMSSAFPCPKIANQKYVLICCVERSSHVPSVISTDHGARLQAPGSERRSWK